MVVLLVLLVVLSDPGHAQDVPGLLQEGGGQAGRPRQVYKKIRLGSRTRTLSEVLRTELRIRIQFFCGSGSSCLSQC